MIKPSLGLIGVCATALAALAAGLASTDVPAAPAGSTSTMTTADDTYTGSAPVASSATSPARPSDGRCTVDAKLVPSCGVLMGVAPGGHTGQDPASALAAFEAKVRQPQSIFHSYHRGISSMFPSREEIAISEQPGHQRALFINWKPSVASWASIAAGDPSVDAYLDRLAGYIKANYTSPFFFTVHHEPENDVIEVPGSGYTAEDYAAMYRHVVLRLRDDGVTNLVTVMDYMAYAPWNTKPWFDSLYPGDDVVDWIGWDMYGYSVPNAYGYGDFAEMLQRNAGFSQWPGIYAWAASRFPDKPLMVAEWGIWFSFADMFHQAAVFASVPAEIAQYPRIKALVYFDSPNAEKGSTLVSSTFAALVAYRAMARQPIFRVCLDPDTQDP